MPKDFEDWQQLLETKKSIQLIYLVTSSALHGPQQDFGIEWSSIHDIFWIKF